MSNPQIGSLYAVEHSHCFLTAFPDMETFRKAFYDGPWCSATTIEAAEGLCRMLHGYNKAGEHCEPLSLFFLKPHAPFLLLQSVGHAEARVPVPIWQVLYKERVGWINAGDHSFIKPFVQ